MWEASRGSTAGRVRLSERNPLCYSVANWLRHSRQEIREGLQRPINRDYYYIDFHATIDAIKYRVLHVTTRVKQMYKPSEEKKDYCCPRCKAQWTQLEVLDSCGPTGFLCHRCGGTLEREEPTAGDSAGSEKQVKLAAQLARVLTLLQDIDHATIPKTDFETALSLQIPVQRNKDVNPVRITVPLEISHGPPAAVKGVNQPVVQDLTVDLTSSAERTAAEKASEENRIASIAAQNALPVWHTQSTVAGGPSASTDVTPGIKRDSTVTAISKTEATTEDDKTTITTAGIDESDELVAYYARMAQEKEKEEREDREDEEESSDDESEGDEFEDVDIKATLSSSHSNLKGGEIADLKPPPSGMSRENNELVSESGSSAPGSLASTPDVAADSNSPVAKRVKVEAANGSGGSEAKPPVSDEDEEAEFEDAL
ncbi:MAG: hypothetical protein LQ343_005372 [Gyalolechia ehrenbergii]|nr:MAG: hypothetical protein LQ343_005372 [Gyalolechia ehrenbergii]